jgi:hypothetical protein
MWRPKFDPKFPSLRYTVVAAAIFLIMLGIGNMMRARYSNLHSDGWTLIILAAGLLIAALRDSRGPRKIVPDHYRLFGNGLDRGGF